MTSRIGHIAIQNLLDIDVNFWESSLSHDGNSVGEGRGCSLSPAGSTVVRDMLVLHLSQVVNSVLISPCEGVWHLFDGLPWHRVNPRVVRLVVRWLVTLLEGRSNAKQGNKNGEFHF